MNNINSFTFGVNRIRVAIVDGEPWFGAADVCSALDIGNVSQALMRLDDEEKGIIPNDTPGGIQGLLHVSESGLYALVLGSRKPEAKSFKKWITSEVLPSIRKTGAYGIQTLIPKTLPEALRAYAVALEEREALELKVREDAPKVEFHERVSEAKDGQSIGDVAKILGTGQNRLFAWLRGQNILMASNLPYQEHLDAGRFRVIEQTWEGRSGQHVSTKTLVTGKGLIWIQKLWDEDHDLGQVS